MAAISAADVALWFIKNDNDHPRDTKEGNMKLQKLLYFAQLVHLARYDEKLFEEKICAFKNGSVIEDVRHLYQYNHKSFIKSAYSTDLNLSSEHLDTLQTVEAIFGELTAYELSEINHHHKSWKDSYERSQSGGYAWKENSEITIDQIKENELDTVREIIRARESGSSLSEYKMINGRKFYYDPRSVQIDDTLLLLLQSFDGPDSAYTIYKDESAGVMIY